MDHAPGPTIAKVAPIAANMPGIHGSPERVKQIETPEAGIGPSLFPGWDYSWIIPRFNPIVTAWVRSLAPSLESMFVTWLLTVSSVIKS